MRLLSTTFLLISLLVYNSYGQDNPLSKEEKSFLRKKAKLVTATNDFSNTQWKAIDEAVRNKQIVALGEFNHGPREVFLLRNELIKYLHQKHNFKTILFESGIGELAWVDLQKKQLSAKQMTYGFFWGWRNQAFQELMQYVQKHQLSVGGFDVQRFGGYFLRLLKKVAEKKQLDTALYRSLERRFTKVRRQLKSRKATYEKVSPITIQLVNDYHKLLNRLKNTTPKKASNASMLVQQTLANRIHYLEYFLSFVKDRNWHQRWVARDSAMANNAIWLLENIFKNQKVIIVGHNFHLAKFNQKEEVMGEFLAKKYGEKMYVLGSFAAKGSYHDNGGKSRKMLPPDSKNPDLKNYINALPEYAYFLPIPDKKRRGNEWLFEPLIVNDTFINLNRGKKMMLAKHFDGLLLLKKVSPPTKMK